MGYAALTRHSKLSYGTVRISTAETKPAIRYLSIMAAYGR